MFFLFKKLDDYRPLINYKWFTGLDTLGVRSLKDSGTSPKYNAQLFYGRGISFDGVDQNIPITINADVKTICYGKAGGGVVYDETAQTLTDFTINSELLEDTRSNYIFYDGLFTDTQKSYLEKYPEKFLYIEDGILKSKILTQSEIDNIVAYLPMCETDGYVRDLVGYSEGEDLIQFPLTNWNISNDGGDSSVSEDDDGNIVFDYKSSDDVYLNIKNKEATPTDVPLKVKIVVESITGSIKVQDSDTDGSFGKIFTAGVYEFVSISNQPNIIIARNDGNEDTNIVISSFEIVELTSTYPIANYTDACRDDAKQLSTGLQTCFWKRDLLGVPYAGSFDRLECDGVGYADTGWMPDYLTNWTIETNIKDDGINDDLFRGIGISANGSKDCYIMHKNGSTLVVKLFDAYYSGSKPSVNTHIVMEFDAINSVFNVSFDGILVATKTVTPEEIINTFNLSAHRRTSSIENFMKSPQSIFKVHTTPRDPLALYESAVSKGLLG